MFARPPTQTQNKTVMIKIVNHRQNQKTTPNHQNQAVSQVIPYIAFVLYFFFSFYWSHIDTIVNCLCTDCWNNYITILKLISFYYWKYVRWYRKHFGEDTAYWFIMLVIREIIEMIFQVAALAYYNGLNVFNPSDTILAYKQSSVLFFAILLGLNGILVGILWCCYVVNSHYCRGVLFKYIVFVIDTLFDTFFALFPIAAIARQTNYNLSVAVGTLQTSHTYVF